MGLDWEPRILFQQISKCGQAAGGHGLETTAQRMRAEHLLPSMGVGKMWEWGALLLSADGVT